MYFKTLEKKDCSGCTACVSACPKQCIAMKPDKEGFFYPVIDKSACIECGLCEKVCSFDKPKYENTEVTDIYACYVKEQKQRQRSTSGGLFYVIAQWVITNGGVVYGAAFDKNFKLHHVGVDNMTDLEKLRGSKYLQSYLGNTFIEIKNHLQNGRWVYFVGCGCQVAGLNAFLRKKNDKLITSDLVCHGAPSQLMFDWHLDYLRRREKGEIISYAFRDLEGWGVCESYEYNSLTRGKGKKFSHAYFTSPYLYSFMWAYNYRYSCYDCKFAQLPRQGDITLADYWGVAKYFPDLERANGVSLVLVNTQQGAVVWDSIKDIVEYRKSNVQDAAAKNKNLVKKTIMPPIRPICYQMIRDRGYDDVAKNEFRMKGNWMLRIKTFLSSSWLWKRIRKLN